MVTVTFNELEVNAVADALTRLIRAETGSLQRLRYIRRQLIENDDMEGLADNTFAIDCAEAAIRHAMSAQLTFATAIPDPEYPAEMTVTRLTVIEEYQGDLR